jgi:hypothetical protein
MLMRALRVALASLMLACTRDPRQRQLEAQVDSAQARSARLLNDPATTPESLSAAFTRLRMAESASVRYRRTMERRP